MAYIKSAAILKRIREVIEDSAGSLRTVPAGRFAGDLPEGLSDDAALVRAASKPRVEARVAGYAPSESSPPLGGNLRIYDVDFEIKLIRIVTPLEQLSDDARDALHGLQLEDAEIVEQALSYPHNLQATSTGTATDLASGLLMHQATKFAVRKPIDEGAQPLETIMTFLGRVLSRPATS